MADSELEEQVTCWVCFEVMEDPTTLHCGHSFCKDCLVKVYKKDPNCPFCRRPFGLPLPEPNKDLLEMVSKLKGKNIAQVPENKPEVATVEQESPLLDLPLEITCHLFDYMEPYNILRASSVCQEFRSIANDPWIWRTLCLEKFPFIGAQSGDDDWKLTYAKRSRLKRGWEEGKSGDFKVVSMRGHEGYINTIDLYKNLAITGSSDGIIKIWRTNTSKLSYECTGHSGLISSAKFNGVYIVSGSMDKTVKIWDSQTGVLIRSIEDFSQGVNHIAFSQDLVISSCKSNVSIHDIRTATRAAHISRLGTSTIASSLLLENEHFVVGSSDGCFSYDMRNTGQHLHGLAKSVHHMEYAGNNLLALSLLGGDIMLWNHHDGSNVWTCKTGSTASISCLKADSSRIIAGTSDGSLYIMKHRNPAVKKLAAHSGQVNDIQFDSQRIITGGADNSVKVWDIKNCSSLYPLNGGSLQTRGGTKPHPTRPGCSNVVFDENRIVGSFANVLKSFNFGTE